MRAASVVAGVPVAQVSLVAAVAVVVAGFGMGLVCRNWCVCAGRECAELEFWLSEGATGWKAQAAEQHICYPSSAVVLARGRHSARCPDRRCG